MEDTVTVDRRVGIATAERITGLHRTTIWRKYRAGAGEFPPPTFIGDRRTWLESELHAWVNAQAARPPEARRGAKNLAGGRAQS